MKLIQFTDFHLRLTPAPESQFHVQPFWRGEYRELFSRLAKLANDADALIFTGDAAHGGGKVEVGHFCDMLAEIAGDRPVFMVLGNHDVVHPDWEEHFKRGTEKYSNMLWKDGVYPLGPMDIALINNEYLTPDGKMSPWWPENCFPVPAMPAEKAAKLDAALSASTSRPAVALVHCPSHVLPATLFDFGTSVLSGMDRYRDALHGVLNKHPRVGLVLSGHVHFNSTRLYEHNRVHHSLASVTEYPYQIRVVEINGTKCHSRLDSLTIPSDAEEDIKFGMK